MVFPQITQSGSKNSDSYSATETFSLYASVLDPLDNHNKPGVSLFTFTLQNNTSVDPMTNPAAFGETTATAPTGLGTLLPNTRYWLVLTNGGGQVAWDYTTNSTYSSALGVTLPATDTVITEDNGQTITNLSDGPQQFVMNASPALVPEPSTYCLMAVAGLALVVSRKRTRKVA